MKKIKLYPVTLPLSTDKTYLLTDPVGYEEKDRANFKFVSDFELCKPFKLSDVNFDGERTGWINGELVIDAAEKEHHHFSEVEASEVTGWAEVTTNSDKSKRFMPTDADLVFVIDRSIKESEPLFAPILVDVRRVTAHRRGAMIEEITQKAIDNQMESLAGSLVTASWDSLIRCDFITFTCDGASLMTGNPSSYNAKGRFKAVSFHEALKIIASMGREIEPAPNCASMKEVEESLKSESSERFKPGWNVFSDHFRATNDTYVTFVCYAPGDEKAAILMEWDVKTGQRLDVLMMDIDKIMNRDEYNAKRDADKRTMLAAMELYEEAVSAFGKDQIIPWYDLPDKTREFWCEAVKITGYKGCK